MNIQEILTTKVGSKVTIFKLGEMGFPQCIPCTIEKVYRKDYAQHADMLHIEYRPVRKRSNYVIRVKDITSLLVYDGHIELKADMYVKTLPSSTGMTLSESLPSFDNGYFDIAKASTEQKPFLEIIK
jgi:hypothetical protein